jgi:hypothetical protein
MPSRRRLTQFVFSRKRVALAALALALAAGLAVGLVLFERGKTKVIPSTVVQAGSVSLQDATWHCRGLVNLTVVRVVLHGGRRDAVHLDPGCTGTIRRLEVSGPRGDGVKVHPGAHDLRILGGYIDCGPKAKGKHQDAIQAMGGHDVVFKNITSKGCANSFMFINRGKHRRGLPTGIVCDSCRAETHNYSIFIGNSIDSGARGSTFVSRVRPKHLPQAVHPVESQNRWTAVAGTTRTSS